MANPVIMPQVGQDVESGFIGEWFVKEGEYVEKGDIIASIESEKATFDLEVYESGHILKILFEPGEEVKTLEPVAYIGEKGEAVPDDGESDSVAEKTEGRNTTEDGSKETATQKNSSRVFASPSARRVAKEQRISLDGIEGSGPGGRIVKKDVLAAAEDDGATRIEKPSIAEEIQEESLATDLEIPFTKMRKKIAERLILSKQTIPHFYLFIDIDMTAALEWRAVFNKNATVKITVNDMIVKSVAASLEKYPRLNAHVIENKIVQRKDINVGVAVSIDDGLIVPVIPKANEKSLSEISATSRKNTEGARQGVLKTPAVGTFTISNLGMYAISGFVPIINPPECGIIGIGKIDKKVVVRERNSIGFADVMNVSIACDHRAVDGSYAAQFLNSIKDYLEKFDQKLKE
ncbi:biotin/lipoyl-binding protein [candidate division KSB1 bacterium]|nr:biotin/lipoyl-binding protein [candidate division KSB1 bacterium]